MTARERLAALAEGTPVATLVMRDDLKTVLADLEAAERERDEAQVALIDAVLAASGHPVALEAAEQRAETLAEYDYEFSVWPVEQHWEPAVYEVFRYAPRVMLTKSADEFASFRDALERSGFSLRETTRVPHHEPELVDGALADRERTP